MPLTRTVFLQTRPIRCSRWVKAPASGLSLSMGSLCVPRPEITPGALATSIWPISAPCCYHSSVPRMRSTSPWMDKQQTICSRVNLSPHNRSIFLILELLFTKACEHSSWKISNNSKVASRFFSMPGISYLAQKTCPWVEFSSAFNFFLFLYPFHWSHLKSFLLLFWDYTCFASSLRYCLFGYVVSTARLNSRSKGGRIS